MSKLALLLFVMLAASNTAAQELEVRITIDEATPTVATVKGRFMRTSAQSLAFLPSYAGVKDLPGRVSDLKLADADKKTVEYKRQPSGEYLAEHAFTWWTYKIDLAQQRNVLNSAHVSWATSTSAILALDDILPQPTSKVHVRLTLDLPQSWQIITNEDRVSENVIDIHDAQRAVVLVGKDWRVTPVPSFQLRLAATGEIQVPDATAAKDIADVYSSYVKLFGSAPAGPPAQIALIRAQGASAGMWEAETRGSTITIATGSGLSPSDAEQRLLQQLRHELFHLWLPNGVTLTGDYDWFYEGFATYEEQKLGVALNQIRFTDFLATLGRAYDIDRFSSRQGSLIDASKNRWAGSSSQVYARGMLVAFICDVAILDASKGKSSVEMLLKQLIDAHHPPAASADGNDTILAVMRSRRELREIADDYIAGSKSVNWTPYLQKTGLDAQMRDQLTSVSVLAKPSGRQKALLDKLGYNNWLKLAPK